MSKSLGLVVKFEIVRQIKKPVFWISVFLIPILLGGIFALSVWQGESEKKTPEVDENTKIAITDEAGILPKDNPFTLYSDKEDGIQAVKSGELEMYYYIPANFTESKKAEFYQVSEGMDLFTDNPGVLRVILRNYVSARLPEIDVLALTGEFEIEEIKLAADGEDANVIGKAIIPIFIAVVAYYFLVSCGNRLTMTVVEEKENRISEMILTSVSAKHLIIGKIIAMIVLAMIQIIAVLVPAIILIFLNCDNPMVSALLDVIEIDPVLIFVNLLLFVFSIAFMTGILTFIGAVTPTARDASNFMAPAIIGTILPFMFVTSFLSGEVNLLVEFITFFPVTAPFALMIRNAVGSLSVLELIIGLIELGVLSALMLNLTVKTFQKNAINFEVALPKFLKKKNK